MASAVQESKVWPVIRVASGNMLEMYDFMVFGYYAAAIGRAFFPKGNEAAQLMSAFATFGVGFLMRPLGALVLELGSAPKSLAALALKLKPAA